MGFFSRAFLVFLMKESKKRRRKQLGKLMAKSRSQPVNLPGVPPLMNPLVTPTKNVSNAHSSIPESRQTVDHENPPGTFNTCAVCNKHGHLHVLSLGGEDKIIFSYVV